MANEMPTVKRRYYTPKEYAAMAGVSLSQVYAEISAGKIVGVRPHGALRIPRDWADEFLDRVDAEGRDRVAADEVADEALARRGRVR
jgi:excisionase family DNA binding protein